MIYTTIKNPTIKNPTVGDLINYLSDIDKKVQIKCQGELKLIVENNVLTITDQDSDE